MYLTFHLYRPTFNKTNSIITTSISYIQDSANPDYLICKEKLISHSPKCLKIPKF